MIYRCYNICPHFAQPCEFSSQEMDSMIGRSSVCPIGEDGNYFMMVNELNEFFCLIVGSRTFSDYDLLEEKTDKLLQNKQGKDITIVSGGSQGADKLAEKYAKERGYRLIVMPADWDGDGKSAGYKRNVRMHEFISTKTDRGVIAFWDGKSKGTQHSFELAKKYNNPIRVIQY